MDDVAQLRYTGDMKPAPDKTPIKVSVFLPPAIHLRAKVRATRDRVSLSQHIARLVVDDLRRERPAKEPAA